MVPFGTSHFIIHTQNMGQKGLFAPIYRIKTSLGPEACVKKTGLRGRVQQPYSACPRTALATDLTGLSKKCDLEGAFPTSSLLDDVPVYTCQHCYRCSSISGRMCHELGLAFSGQRGRFGEAISHPV